MIARLIQYSIDNWGVVLILGIVAVAFGLYSFFEIPVDAIPDLSDVQVIIQSEFPGQSPQIVEDQVTYPLSTAMLAVPKAKVVRGFSFFGLSFVYIIFEEGTDIYWARSRVLESLSSAVPRLPQGVTTQLGPDATGVGWVYEYVLEDTTGKYDLSDLRSLQDWFLKYELSALPGVAEVASVGGYVKQYQVEVDPYKLAYFGIPLSHVKEAIKKSNQAVGGRLLEMGETEFMVRSVHYVKGLDDLKDVVVHTPKEGPPVLLSSVAEIHYGPELRRGLAELDGKGEVVGGIVVMRWGENARQVIKGVKEKLDELKESLPQGITLKPVYDRSGLIDRAVNNLNHTLIKEMIIVALIILLFLFHLRSTLIALFTLPAGILLSILTMYLLGISANIMSLAGIAIAIGVMVDASVVMVENAHKHLERDPGKKTRRKIISDSAKEVGPAIFFSLVIITVSFLPVLVLGEQSGRLFRPLAYTKTFAMAASALLSVTVIPALMLLFVKGKMLSESKNPISKLSIALYRPVINTVLKYRWLSIIIVLIIIGFTFLPLSQIGSEFMPPLYEGDLLYMPTTLPGISITKAKELLQQTDKIITTFPEVETVFGKIGRAETATDPAPLSMIETTILLKPVDKWRKGLTPEMLIDSLDRAIRFPGLTNAWTMPIKTRIDMLATGIKTPVGIKIMGSDLDTLNSLGQRIEALIRIIPGTRSVYAERITGGNYVDFVIDRQRASAYGLNIGDINKIIQSAVGGMNLSWTVEGLERYPINLRYPRELRDDLEALSRVLIPTPSGAQVPLGQLAQTRVSKGPAGIKSENARPTAWVYVDIKGVDVGTYVKQAQSKVSSEIEIPPGYSMVWSGQYEYMQAATRQLRIIVPLTILVIFLLLYFLFKSFTQSLIVMLSLPFSLVGGIWLFYIFGFNTSVAVYVGFIALAGLAAETGVVMLVYLNEAVNRYKKENRLNSEKDLKAAIKEGAVERVRPKLMTVSTTMLALLPALSSTGTGSEVMQRIAAPMVGGLVSSTLLTLIVIPLLYFLVMRKKSIK